MEVILVRRFRRNSTETIFEKSAGNTRGHDFELLKKRVRSDTGKYSISNRVQYIHYKWNNLQGWVNKGMSVNEFGLRKVRV